MRAPTWDQAAGGRPSPLPRASAVRGDPRAVAGDGMARAAEAIYGAVEDWTERARRQREKTEAVEAAKLYSETTLAWQEKLTAAQAEAPENGEGFVAGMRETLDADMAQRLAAAPESARPWLETRYADLRARVLGNAMETQAGLRLAAQSRNLSDIVSLNANGVRTDPARLSEAVGVVEGAIAASSLTAAAKAEARTKARSALGFAAVSALNEQDPASARAALDEGRYDAFLSPEDKHRLVNDNHVEARRREAEAEQRRRLAEIEARARTAEVRERARWAVTALSNGQEWQGVDALIAEAEAVDPETATLVRTAKADLNWTRGLVRLPPDDIAAEVAAAKAAAEAAPDEYGAQALSERARRGETVLNTVRQELTRDPLGWAARSGVVELPQLDPTDPEVMRERSVAARMAAEHFGVPMAPFTAEEMGYLAQRTEAGSAADTTAMLRALRALPDDQFAATMETLAPKAPAFVAAAGIAAEDPAAAERVLQGAVVRKELPGTVPSKTDYRPEFDDLLGEALNASPATRRQVEEAVLSVYAAESARAGETTGVYDGDRFADAVRTVTGGLVEWRGHVLLPPRRGMSQEQFGGLMRGLTDEAVAGAVTLSGDPLTARQVRQGALEQVGNGQYLVRLPTGYAMGADGRPYVLDLSSRLAPGAGLAPPMGGAP